MDESHVDEAVIAAHIAAVVAQHGDALDDAQRAKLRQEMIGAWQRAQRIRAVPLANADAPFLSFSPQSERDNA